MNEVYYKAFGIFTGMLLTPFAVFFFIKIKNYILYRHLPKFYLDSFAEDFKGGRSIHSFINKNKECLVSLPQNSGYIHDGYIHLKNGYINTVYRKGNSVEAYEICRGWQLDGGREKYWMNGHTLSQEDSVALRNLKGKELLNFYEQLLQKYPERN